MNELTTTLGEVPPEKWKSFAGCSINRKTLVKQGENPIEVHAESKEGLMLAINTVNKWLLPASAGDIYKGLLRIHAVTASRLENDEDFEVKFKFYAMELQMFPGDIVLDFIYIYPEKYFPTLHDLTQKIISDGRLSYRKKLLRALEELFEVWEKPKPTRKPVTAEQVSKLDDLVRRNREKEYS